MTYRVYECKRILNGEKRVITEENKHFKHYSTFCGGCYDIAEPCGATEIFSGNHMIYLFIKGEEEEIL